MGKVYARLIHAYVYDGTPTKYESINDVPAKYQAATRAAWDELYGTPIPE